MIEFSNYQPLHGRQLDVGNKFDRAMLAYNIRHAIDQRLDYLVVIDDLLRAGLMSTPDHVQRYGETQAHLQRHYGALSDLYDLCGGNL